MLSELATMRTKVAKMYVCDIDLRLQQLPACCHVTMALVLRKKRWSFNILTFSITTGRDGNVKIAGLIT